MKYQVSFRPNIFSCWKIFHLFAAVTREIFFNTQREISYLCAAM